MSKRITASTLAALVLCAFTPLLNARDLHVDSANPAAPLKRRTALVTKIVAMIEITSRTTAW